MGMRKRTFDPGKGAGKNKCRTNINNLIKNNFISPELISQKTFIKSCQSITVAGKKEKGRIKINQGGHGKDGH